MLYKKTTLNTQSGKNIQISIQKLFFLVIQQTHTKTTLNSFANWPRLKIIPFIVGKLVGKEDPLRNTKNSRGIFGRTDET